MRSVPKLLALLCTIAILAVACDSDSSKESGDGDSGSDGGGDTAAVFGTADPATGEPFRVGFIVDRGGEGSDASEYETAGSATVDYVNDYRRGIEGRPLEISYCSNQNTDAGTTACVNEFVQDGLSAVLVASLGHGDAAVTTASGAGIPYAAFLGASTLELTSPDVVSMSGASLAILGSPGVVMERDGLTKLGILSVDVPSATQAVQSLAIPQYEASGYEAELVAVPAGTADMSANVQAAADSELWLVLGDVSFCTTALTALQSQFPDVPVIVASLCVGSDLASSLPNGYEGVTAVAGNRLDPEDEETDLYRAVLDEYANPDDLESAGDGFLTEGYSTVLGFDRLMQGYTGDGSQETVGAHLRSASAPLPLGGGIEMMCGQSPIEFLPALCSVSGYLIELDADGNGVEFELVDVAAFFNGG